MNENTFESDRYVLQDANTFNISSYVNTLVSEKVIAKQTFGNT